MRKRAFGTYTVAKICHVAPITVGRWLEDKKIPFFTTGGGNKRIWDIDLIRFLQSHNYPIPKSLKPLKSPIFLIVNQSHAARKLTRNLLLNQFSMAHICEAQNEYEAGELVASIRPNLIILAMDSPMVDGGNICQLIRKNPLNKTIKILMCSNNATQKIREKAIQAGANAFLKKPFSKDSFLTVISQLLKIGNYRKNRKSNKKR